MRFSRSWGDRHSLGGLQGPTAPSHPSPHPAPCDLPQRGLGQQMPSQRRGRGWPGEACSHNGRSPAAQAAPRVLPGRPATQAGAAGGGLNKAAAGRATLAPAPGASRHISGLHLSSVQPSREAGAHSLRLGSLSWSRGPQERKAQAQDPESHRIEKRRKLRSSWGWRRVQGDSGPAVRDRLLRPIAGAGRLGGEGLESWRGKLDSGVSMSPRARGWPSWGLTSRAPGRGH